MDRFVLKTRLVSPVWMHFAFLLAINARRITKRSQILIGGEMIDFKLNELMNVNVLTTIHHGFSMMKLFYIKLLTWKFFYDGRVDI